MQSLVPLKFIVINQTFQIQQHKPKSKWKELQKSISFHSIHIFQTTTLQFGSILKEAIFQNFFSNFF
jgi:hypothetical protein